MSLVVQEAQEVQKVQVDQSFQIQEGILLLQTWYHRSTEVGFHRYWGSLGRLQGIRDCQEFLEDQADQGSHFFQEYQVDRDLPWDLEDPAVQDQKDEEKAWLAVDKLGNTLQTESPDWGNLNLVHRI